MYIFLINIGRQQFSNITSFKFFPLIGSTFPFILLANFTGSTPLAFTITSHIYVTFLLAFSLFLGITILGIYYNKLTFIRFFLPTGVPKFLIPFLIVIEVISYLIRPFSLSIRLFANMLAGHTLLVILSGFVPNSSIISVLGIHLIPFIFVFLVVSLEIGIAFIQAYVFCVLLFIYLNDVYKLIP
jgi:ATP synthase subunit 6